MSTDPGNGGMSATDEAVAVEKLSAECSVHGTVPVHCPRSLGKRGGKRHKGTTWKSKKELEAIRKFDETTRRVLDLQPEAKLLEEMAEDRKRFQGIARKLGWSEAEAQLHFTRMLLAQGIQHLRDLSVAMGMTAEERTELRQGIQKAVALGNPDEVPAILERYRRKQ